MFDRCSIRVAGERDGPGARAPRQVVCHGVNRDRDRRETPQFAIDQNGFDRRVIRLEPTLDTQRPGFRGKISVAWDDRAVALFGNQVQGRQMAITVNHQPDTGLSTAVASKIFARASAIPAAPISHAMWRASSAAGSPRLSSSAGMSRLRDRRRSRIGSCPRPKHPRTQLSVPLVTLTETSMPLKDDERRYKCPTTAERVWDPRQRPLGSDFGCR